MRQLGLSLVALCLATAPVMAQDLSSETDTFADANSLKAEGETQTMAALLKQGYEIKAAVPSGTTKVIIFMQNEKSAYACEFTNLANTRCGSIN